MYGYFRQQTEWQKILGQIVAGVPLISFPFSFYLLVIFIISVLPKYFIIICRYFTENTEACAVILVLQLVLFKCVICNAFNVLRYYGGDCEEWFILGLDAMYLRGTSPKF